MQQPFASAVVFQPSPPIPPPVAAPEPQQQAAASAYGRAMSSLFFAFFGAAWLSQALMRLGWQSGWAAAGLLAGALVLALPAVMVMRQTAVQARPARATAENKRVGRWFLLVNVLQWAAIMFAVNLLPYFHRADLVVPVIMFVVGVHMFPLAKLYYYPLHYLTRALLVGCAVGSWLLLAEPLRDAYGSAATGMVIWGSAVATLRLALQRARQAAAA